MSDDLELDVDVLAAMLRDDQRESGDFVTHVAQKLEGALPEQTSVERGGGFFARKKTVASVAIEFADARYVLTREKRGPVGRRERIVRGVRLSTHELGIEEWVAEVAREIQRLAEQSASARAALEKFVLGD